MRNSVQRFFDRLRARFSDFNERVAPVTMAAFRKAGVKIAPGVQRGLLRMPGLDESLQRFAKLEWLVALVLGLVAADLASTGLGRWLGGGKEAPAPAPIPQTRKSTPVEPHIRSYSEYGRVLSVNPFCPGCPIPDLAKLERPKDCGNAKPLQVGSVKLIGTIVLSDPQYSVATVSRGSESVALQKGDQMNGVGEVYEIRQGRVCFLMGNGGLQFVELPSDMIKFESGPAPVRPTRSFTPTSVRGVDRVSETEFNVSKTELVQKLNDPTLLTDAYALPVREDGDIKGFKIATIKPGSVYESLGVQVGDVIAAVNGDPLNSIAKVQELYASLTQTDKVTITINRNGQDVNMTYSIK